jgi:integrase/recombinase XerC
MTCGCGCGTTFFRASHRPNKHGLVFASSRHYGDFVANKLLEKSCGHFRAIADEYLNGIAKRHYREVRGARRALASLFLFLMERGITSLEEVSPQTITTYILWMNETGRKLGSDTLSCISTFFGWTISDGRRDKANPVTRWHRPPKKKRKPRPLKPYELETMWRLLIERGDARVCLAAALGQESGLRISEICRLEISDVDLEAQRLFVRLPNKSQTERYAFFGEKTTRYWHEWMHERRESCGHERALYNNIGTPYTRDTLADAFKRVLLKSEKGVDGDGDGFETWSTHRLRHTMASALVAGGADLATVMEAGGWLDPDTMTGYTEVSIEQARHGYDEAMRTFHKQKELPRQTRIVNADELLQIWATEDENEGALEKSADCV